MVARESTCSLRATSRREERTGREGEAEKNEKEKKEEEEDGARSERKHATHFVYTYVCVCVCERWMYSVQGRRTKSTGESEG